MPFDRFLLNHIAVMIKPIRIKIYVKKIVSFNTVTDGRIENKVRSILIFYVGMLNCYITF